MRAINLENIQNIKKKKTSSHLHDKQMFFIVVLGLPIVDIVVILGGEGVK